MTKPGEMATARRPRIEPPEGTPSTFVITVVEGKDAGLVLTIDASGPSRALVGKSPACLFRLDDPEVSRRHAALAVVGAELQVIDLGSSNGTTVNGVLVKEAYLVGGEALRLGGTVLSIQRESPRFVPLGQQKGFGRFLGESRAMRKLYPVLKNLAEVKDQKILLEGEPGTGKELLAEEIHRHSPRAEGPFVTVSASTLPADALQDAIFGDDGLLAAAEGGTLFVDEVGDLPLPIQIRLRDTDRDVRLVCATRSHLDSEAFTERFDEDLFFKLVPGRIELPPLRDREGDVALLARHFFRRVAGEGGGDLPADFLPRFEHYSWPGNVKELESAVTSRHVQGELGVAFRADVTAPGAGDFLTQVLDRDLPFPRARELVVHEFEKRYVEKVLARHGGSVARAAVASGVAHRYFQLIRARLR
jgi:DNA-binding NtrC family response regulator